MIRFARNYGQPTPSLWHNLSRTGHGPAFRSFTRSSSCPPQDGTGQLSNDTRSSTESSTLQHEREADIVGTVPYHTSYTLLEHPRPPMTYPPKLDAAFSRLGRALTVQAVQRKGIVNFWSINGKHEEIGSTGAERGLEEKGEEERYPFVTFFASRSERTQTDSDSLLKVGVRTGIISSSDVGEAIFDAQRQDVESWDERRHGVYLLVCTHGARDCRCGVRGTSFVASLRRALAALRERDEDEDSVWRNIRVGEVGHVGGHKYAPNLLVFPFGDWLAQLTDAHVPSVLYGVASRLELLRQTKGRPQNTHQSDSMDDLKEHLLTPLINDSSVWRGRMGLTKEEQVQLFTRFARETERPL